MNQQWRDWWKKLYDDPFDFIMENTVKIFVILIMLTVAVMMIKPVWHMFLDALKH